MALAGLIDPAKTLYASNRFIWLSALVGGLLFGFGMVLASGCGSKTLVRIGGGNLKSLVVFLVMGLAALCHPARASRPWCAWPRWTRWPSILPATPPCRTWAATALGLSPALAGLLLALVLGGGLIVWALAGPEFRRFDNLLAGLGIGLR